MKHELGIAFLEGVMAIAAIVAIVTIALYTAG